jgi:hypothetical protein
LGRGAAEDPRFIWRWFIKSFEVINVIVVVGGTDTNDENGRKKKPTNEKYKVTSANSTLW